MPNHIKAKLKQGQVTIGTWIQLPDPSVAEIIGNSGYDWAAVDIEHGHFSNQTLPNIFRSLEIGGTVPFVRLSKSDPYCVKGVLDAGAKGIILPNILDSQTLSNCVQSAFYPPKGNRGVGFSRANLFGGEFSAYSRDHINNIVIVAQIENIEAIKNLREILKVPDLDAIIIGPYDLSGSMGITAEFENAEFITAMDLITREAKKANVPMGLHIVMPNEKELDEKIREGYQFIAYGTDAVFLFENSRNPKA